MNLPTSLRGVLVILAAVVATSACDDQVKYVPWFETMTTQPSVETYEAEPMAPVAGTVPAGSDRHLDLLAADTLLTNPLEGAAEDLEQGEVLYLQFCVMCHGESGAGDGPVVGPNRLPPLPTLNLLSERALDLSDGYIYGMIANGRGVMPSYRRVQHDDRWYLVEYVRKLQEEAPASE
ncbi:MAG: cytochrome c [Gemmatimonadetes bacterium]|nr:cytochrome c [Gemmatimonadota bacterium]NNK47556.1 cytochrome c [Gemmatimonadota bacterium]